MIRLQQTYGAHTGRSVTFDHGPVRCGRQPDNELALDPNADLDASGYHAELVRDGRQWKLTDTKSRNGTWVNGQRVVQATLADGDEIEFGAGGPRFRVELLEPDAPTMPPPTGHVSIRPPPLDARAVLFEPRPSSAPPTPHAPTAAPAFDEPPRPSVAEPVTTSKVPSYPLPPASPPARRGLGMWLVAGLGCVSLLVVGLAVGVGFWWFQRVRTPPPTAADASRIANAHAGALFTVLHRDPAGRDREICAGFAVRRDLVATSARCVHALQAAAESGHRAYVRPPGGVLQEVAHMYRHPGMPAGAQVGPDVGLLRVSGSAPALTSLAPSSEVDGLPDGTAIFVWAAAGTGGGLRGGRVTNVGDLPNAGPHQQLHYSLLGTPGSPVFDREGRVVGVHAGTPSQDAVPGYGVRIDVLHGLLAGL
ncbi:MAG: FHA domain-containing protein [Myxococcales bacterium]|nr:FHA domain-containing protein [Myxococcales bacterium]MCB9628731.1 FHA domain-containing protein [Sandaracinaceae bacterium]